MKGELVYSTDVSGIMQEFRYSHRPDKWRLFIDSSKLSLKAVLLHNKNMLPSISVGYAAHLKKPYENMKQLLQCINNEQYCWQLCGDFKVIAILQRLQPGYTKYCWFLCEWDSRARHEHYLKLGLMKNFVKAMNQDGAAFKYICNKFPVFPVLSLLEINRNCLTVGKLKECDCKHKRFYCCISVNVCIRRKLKLKIFQNES